MCGGNLKQKLAGSKMISANRVRPQSLVGMIRHGCAVAPQRPPPDAKSNGATVADQYDTTKN